MPLDTSSSTTHLTSSVAARVLGYCLLGSLIPCFVLSCVINGAGFAALPFLVVPGLLLAGHSPTDLLILLRPSS